MSFWVAFSRRFTASQSASISARSDCSGVFPCSASACSTALKRRVNLVLARRMFDHVTRLSPEYAEGWSRSARLAIDENDLQRAATDVTQALVYEPRHFYALWTMGNILEKLGRTDKAFEAYEAAHKLYPQHEEIKARVEYLRDGAQGQAL